MSRASYRVRATATCSGESLARQAAAAAAGPRGRPAHRRPLGDQLAPAGDPAQPGLGRQAHRGRPAGTFPAVLVARQPLRTVPPRHGHPPRPHRRLTPAQPRDRRRRGSCEGDGSPGPSPQEDLAPFAAAMITAPTNEKAATADAYLTVLSHGEIARSSFPGSGPGRRGELDGFPSAPYFALGRSYRSSRPSRRNPGRTRRGGHPSARS